MNERRDCTIHMCFTTPQWVYSQVIILLSGLLVVLILDKLYNNFLFRLNL